MSHNAEKWWMLLSEFQDAFAKHHGAFFALYALTWLERRGTIKTDGQPWAQFGETIGNVPLGDNDEDGYTIVTLRPDEGPSTIAELHRQMISDGIPLDARHNEARSRFEELAALAGAALPRSIRDAIPYAPANADSWWLATMWWSKPPSPQELNERGYRVIWCSPFLDSIETIERCNLTGENPSLHGEGRSQAGGKGTVERQAKSSNDDWIKTDPPPSDWHQECLVGNQTKIMAALGIKEEGTFHDYCRDGDKYWVMKEGRYKFVLYCRHKARFETAKRQWESLGFGIV